MKITKITKKAKQCKVYDITVDKSHHYILSNQVITHNSGGGGLKFAASQIVFLSKKQHKETIGKVDSRVGTIITAKLDKSRTTREGLKVETLLRFDRGLDRYFGLIDIAEAAGVIKKLSKQYEFPDGTKAFETSIEKNPEKYFTMDVLKAIDAYTQANWVYGSGEAPAEEEEEIDVNTAA